MLFEEEQHLGDCSITERFAMIFAKPLIGLLRHNNIGGLKNGKLDDTFRDRKGLQSSRRVDPRSVLERLYDLQRVEVQQVGRLQGRI